MLDIDHTSASNSDQVATQQAIGRIETVPIIPWSGLSADMISKPGQSGMPVHTPTPMFDRPRGK